MPKWLMPEWLKDAVFKEVFAIGEGTLKNGTCRLSAQSFGVWHV